MAAFSKTSEIGSMGLDQWSGMINVDPMRDLRGKSGYKKYEEMRLNSPIVGALLMAIEGSIRTAEFNYVSDEGEDDPRLELLNESLAGMTTGWSDHLSEVLTMLPFGYSLFETVYRRDGARLLWHKFAIRGQDTVERWGFSDDGGLTGFYQRAAPAYKEIFIPIEKCILFRTRVERNNPEGRSILRNAYTSYYYLKNIQQIEGIGIERDLAGLPVIKLPPGATDDENSTTSDVGKAKKIVRNIRRDEQEGITLPDGWELTLLSTGGTRQFDTNGIIQRYESRMLMSALSQFLILGQSNVGTQALSQDLTDFFGHAIDYFADIIAETHTKFAAHRLLELNGFETDGIRMTHTPVGDVDLAKIGSFLQQVGSMITWTVQDETWLRDIASLPEIAPEDLEVERERKQQVAIEMMQRGPTNPDEDKGNEPDKEPDKEPKKKDELSAGLIDMLSADAPPDDDQRRKWERKLARLQMDYFTKQQRRIMAAVKRLKL